MSKFKTRIFPAAPALALAALLTACGGGGGDDGVETPAVTSVNVAAAWRNFLTGPGNWQATGPGPDGKAYVFSVAINPGSPGTFSFTGQSGQTSTQTSSISVDGVNLGQSIQTLYYNGDNLFGIDYDDGNCSVVQPLASPLPDASPVGSGGSLPTQLEYGSCVLPQQSHYATTENQWTIESDSNVTLFCVTSTEIGLADQAVAGKEKDCLEVAADGTLGKKAKFILYLSDTESIVARNF
jgi:hypothetical protein